LHYVLIIISGAIIDQVIFYDNPSTAVHDLSEFVKTMNPEKHDAAVYGPEGLISNTKDFLDENDQLKQHVIITVEKKDMV
jgi:hypothetical protein